MRRHPSCVTVAGWTMKKRWKSENVWTIQPPDVGINAAACISLCVICAAGRRAGARPDGAFGDYPLLAAAAADDAQEPRRERAQRLIEGFGFDRQRMVAIGPPVTVRDRPSRHQVPGGRIMRAKNALISGEASWPSEIVQRHQDSKRIGLVGRCGFRSRIRASRAAGRQA
jgi:hypothetical protein